MANGLRLKLRRTGNPSFKPNLKYAPKGYMAANNNWGHWGQGHVTQTTTSVPSRYMCGVTQSTLRLCHTWPSTSGTASVSYSYASCNSVNNQFCSYSQACLNPGTHFVIDALGLDLCGRDAALYTLGGYFAQSANL
eukprot:jgi/Botrbrau1/6426/Bobra.0034s0002.1